MRSAWAGKGSPKASCSAASQPAPSPRVRRPGAISASVAAALASTRGGRKVADSTSVPIPTRPVAAASAVSAVHASSTGTSGSGMPSRWSGSQTSS